MATLRMGNDIIVPCIVKETGITPTGTINIEDNGQYDVTNYSQADVSIKNYIEIISPQVPFEIYKNVYYSGTLGDKNLKSYQGWDATAPIDISDVEYIAFSNVGGTLPGYTYRDGGNISYFNMFFSYKNSTYYIYKCNRTTEIGFSNLSNVIVNYKYYKIKSISTLETEIREVSS